MPTKSRRPGKRNRGSLAVGLGDGDHSPATVGRFPSSRPTPTKGPAARGGGAAVEAGGRARLSDGRPARCSGGRHVRCSGAGGMRRAAAPARERFPFYLISSGMGSGAILSLNFSLNHQNTTIIQKGKSYSYRSKVWQISEYNVNEGKL
jgi:hypothetical protein